MATTPGGPKLRLQGFNNLTKVVRFNLYAFQVAQTPSERQAYVERLDRDYGAAKMTQLLRDIARIIDAEVLSVSMQDYEPHGASSLLLMSDVAHELEPEPPAPPLPGSVGAHLSKSHLCAHTYPDWLDPKGICTFRVDIDIATCGTIVPLRALNYLFEQLGSDVVVIDYVVRGFTRDTRGQRVYLDHALGSIQEFIDPRILGEYHAEDLHIPALNTWQTRLMRRELDPAAHFPAGRELEAPESLAALEDVRREMAAIYGSR